MFEVITLHPKKNNVVCSIAYTNDSHTFPELLLLVYALS